MYAQGVIRNKKANYVTSQILHKHAMIYPYKRTLNSLQRVITNSDVNVCDVIFFINVCKTPQSQILMTYSKSVPESLLEIQLLKVLV